MSLHPRILGPRRTLATILSTEGLFPTVSCGRPTTVPLSMKKCAGDGRGDPACPTHSPPQAQAGREELGRGEGAPTSEHDTAKDGVVPVHGGAVPAVVAELVLTLSDPLSGTLAHRAHDVWVTLAQLPLPAHQTRDIVTDHSGPQRPDVPARWRRPCQSPDPFSASGQAWHSHLGVAPSLPWPTFPEADG